MNISEIQTYSSDGNNCPISSCAYFLPQIKKHHYQIVLSQCKPQGGQHLLYLDQVLREYLKISQFYPYQVLINDGDIINFDQIPFQEKYILVIINRFKRENIKSMKIINYEERNKKYNLYSILYHKGIIFSDGHFYTKINHKDIGWLRCDGSQINKCTLQKGSRQAVMLLYIKEQQTVKFNSQND